MPAILLIVPMLFMMPLSHYLHLPLQWLEGPLNSVYAHRKSVDQVEGLGVFGQHWRKHAADNVTK